MRGIVLFLFFSLAAAQTVDEKEKEEVIQIQKSIAEAEDAIRRAQSFIEKQIWYRNQMVGYLAKKYGVDLTKHNYEIESGQFISREKVPDEEATQ